MLQTNFGANTGKNNPVLCTKKDLLTIKTISKKFNEILDQAVSIVKLTITRPMKVRNFVF